MPSPIDILFQSIFGFLPAKEGEAYEKLASIACKLVDKDQQVQHDKRLRGEFSKTLYQIDVLTSKENAASFGEAKDYTARDEHNKVGRGDLQKLGGALPEVPVEGGVFFSATGYTKPAKKYAASAKEIVGKPITLFHLRPVTEKDMQGRITSIHLQFHILLPDYEKAHFAPILTPEGDTKAAELLKSHRWKAGEGLRVDTIYDSKGGIITTIRDLTAKGFGDACNDKHVAGSFELIGGHLKVSGELVPISGMDFDITYIETVRTIVIKANGEAALLLKEEGGAVDKVITTLDLKRVRFDADGQAIIDA